MKNFHPISFYLNQKFVFDILAILEDGFSEMQNLKTHLKRHRGEKLNKCNQCDLTVTQWTKDNNNNQFSGRLFANPGPGTKFDPIFRSLFNIFLEISSLRCPNSFRRPDFRQLRSLDLPTIYLGKDMLEDYPEWVFDFGTWHFQLFCLGTPHW